MMGRKSKNPEREQDRKKGGGIKSFFKVFIIALIIFVAVLTPLNSIKNQFLNWQPFEKKQELNLTYMVDENSPFFRAFQDTNRINILALGVNDGMTDVIMLASYDLDANHVDVISIPRDTYYPRKGHGGAAAKKINAVYASKDGGAEGAAQAVSDILQGIPINYYMVVDYDAVKKIVDSMGGIPMDIPFNMKYNDPYDKPPLRINIPKGHRVLDGEHAVQFLRYRKGYPNGDIGRIEAHQQFIKSAFKQALGGNLYDVVQTTLNEVESNVDMGVILTVVKGAVTGLSGEDMQTWMVPGKSGMKDGLSYWFADEEETKDMLMQIYSIDEKSTSDGGIEE